MDKFLKEQKSPKILDRVEIQRGVIAILAIEIADTVAHLLIRTQSWNLF